MGAQVVLLFLLLSILVGGFLYVNLFYVDKKLKWHRRRFNHQIEGLQTEVAQMSHNIGRRFADLDKEIDWTMSEVSDIYDEINTLNRRQRQIAEGIQYGALLRQGRPDMDVSEDFRSLGGPVTNDPNGDALPSSSDEQAVQALAEAYSRSIGRVAEKESFESEYRPRRLSVANTRERREKEARVPPLFSPDKSGTYWLVDLDDQKVLLPLPSMTVEDGHRDAGGFDEAFDCKHYPKGEIYKIGSVVLPGFLERAEGEGQWLLSKPGEVRLKHYL